MTLFLLHTPTHFSKLTISTSISCFSSTDRGPLHNRKIPKLPSTQHHLPPAARDRVIDFGKYKGKPLGSLPSTYLKWVSNNLRARDFHHWAELADEVLHDPVYNDRIEWELAESVLTGNTMSRNSFSGGGESENAAARLAKLSERFGWDNEDKVGWSKVDFKLLGTSNGSRIPRKVEGKMGNEELKMVDEEKKKMKESRRRRMRNVRDKMGIRDDGRGRFGNVEKNDHQDDEGGSDQDRTVEIKSPFPGREALLKKVLRSKRFL